MSQPVSNPPSTTSYMARPIAAKPVAPSREHVSGASYPNTAAPIMVNLGAVADNNALGATIPALPSPSLNLDSTISRSFESKFSASTEMILKRIREGGPLNTSAALGLGIEGGIQPPRYESVRRSLLQGMKTTLDMDLDVIVPLNSVRRTKSTIPKANAGSLTPISAGSGTSAVVTHSMSDPVFVPTTKTKVTLRTGKTRAGAKRKRGREESESSEESGSVSDFGDDSDSEGGKSVANMPTKTLSGRKVVRPAQFDPAAVEGSAKKRAPHRRPGRTEQVLCKRCGRGHSPTSNMIVFCDGCNLGWHQMCHDPVVSDELVKEENKEWFCHHCNLKRVYTTSLVPEISKNCDWAGKNTEEKYIYLSTFPQPHLVSLLLQATLMYPDIPIYPPATISPSSIQQLQPQSEPSQLQNPAQSIEQRPSLYTQPAFQPSATSTTRLFTRADTNPSATINFIRKIQPGSASPVSPFATSFRHDTIYVAANKSNGSANSVAATNSAAIAPQFQQSASALLPLLVTQPGQGNGDDESRESTPASPPYPKPGNGLMAKLPPDDQDLEWLVGDGDDEAAFSHVVIDAQSRMKIINEKDITTATTAREDTYIEG